MFVLWWVIIQAKRWHYNNKNAQITVYIWWKCINELGPANMVCVCVCYPGGWAGERAALGVGPAARGQNQEPEHGPVQLPPRVPHHPHDSPPHHHTVALLRVKPFCPFLSPSRAEMHGALQYKCLSAPAALLHSHFKYVKSLTRKILKLVKRQISWADIVLEVRSSGGGTVNTPPCCHLALYHKYQFTQSHYCVAAPEAF